MKNTTKRTIGWAIIASLIGSGAALGVASSASAHDGGVTATCTTLSADLTNYPAGSTISGTLDGIELGTTTFGPSFSQSVPLDPALPHSWSVKVTSGDGDPRYSFTTVGTSDPACIPVVEEPPVVVTPDVWYVQDFITCAGGAFVLDNTGSRTDRTYTVQGVDYLVPAGTALHTDADGTLIQPLDGTYTITAGEQTWTFPSPGNCPTTPPVTTEPEPTNPPVVVVPPTDEPTEPQPTPSSPTLPPTGPSESGETPSSPTPSTQPSSSPSARSDVPAAAVPASADEPTDSPDVQHVGALAYTGAGEVMVGIFLAAVAIAAGFAAIIVPILRRRARS